MNARLLAYPGPRPSISLAFELHNDGGEDWSGVVVEPAVPWDLRAWVDGAEVVVRKPMLELPSHVRSLSLAPGERAELPCPVVLVFEERPDDAFLWSLDTPPPAALELEATVKAGSETLPTGRTSVTMPARA
jgi:hypothetical protein